MAMMATTTLSPVSKDDLTWRVSEPEGSVANITGSLELNVGKDSGRRDGRHRQRSCRQQEGGGGLDVDEHLDELSETDVGYYVKKINEDGLVGKMLYAKRKKGGRSSERVVHSWRGRGNCR
jgi:hypothetical protein